MQAPETPEAMIQGVMKQLSVSREVAIYMLTKAFEATLRVGATEAEQNRELLRLYVADSRERHPMAVEFIVSQYRKNLPAWIKINDEALAKGQDPATALSIATKVSMKTAQERIERIKAHKNGATMDQLAEAALAEDDGKSFEDLWSEFIESQA